MKFVRLNDTWNAEPNAPDPRIEMDYSNNTLRLKFYLNAFMYKDVNEENVGVLEFHNCVMYRLGATNDHGFYKGQCRFSNTDIEWGYYYLLLDSDWEENFPLDKVILNEAYKTDRELKHYLFYLRDQTFECISKGYSFTKLNGGE